MVWMICYDMGDTLQYGWYVMILIICFDTDNMLWYEYVIIWEICYDIDRPPTALMSNFLKILGIFLIKF